MAYYVGLDVSVSGSAILIDRDYVFLRSAKNVYLYISDDMLVQSFA